MRVVICWNLAQFERLGSGRVIINPTRKTSRQSSGPALDILDAPHKKNRSLKVESR